MTRRTEQVASLMQKELGEHMLTLELPALTTISRVEVSEDLKHAKVWITVLTEDERVEKEVMDELARNLYDIQGEVNRRFTMHYVPRIHFAIDNSQHYASRINDLLRKAHQDDEQQQS